MKIMKALKRNKEKSAGTIIKLLIEIMKRNL